MLREPVAVGSWLVLAAVCILSPKRLSPPLNMVLTAVAFFVAAAATRYWLRETQSRWQVLAFALAAALVALWRWRRAEDAAGVRHWLAWAASAAVAIMLVRWATEGSPI